MSIQRGLGWCWHRWSKWSDIKTVAVTDFRNRDAIDWYQQRICEKCGRIQQREVGYQ